jgi:hypothetical protein
MPIPFCRGNDARSLSNRRSVWESIRNSEVLTPRWLEPSGLAGLSLTFPTKAILGNVSDKLGHGNPRRPGHRRTLASIFLGKVG